MCWLQLCVEVEHASSMECFYNIQELVVWYYHIQIIRQMQDWLKRLVDLDFELGNNWRRVFEISTNLATAHYFFDGMNQPTFF